MSCKGIERGESILSEKPTFLEGRTFSPWQGPFKRSKNISIWLLRSNCIYWGIIIYSGLEKIPWQHCKKIIICQIERLICLRRERIQRRWYTLWIVKSSLIWFVCFSSITLIFWFLFLKKSIVRVMRRWSWLQDSQRLLIVSLCWILEKNVRRVKWRGPIQLTIYVASTYIWYGRVGTWSQLPFFRGGHGGFLYAYERTCAR